MARSRQRILGYKSKEAPCCAFGIYVVIIVGNSTREFHAASKSVLKGLHIQSSSATRTSSIIVRASLPDLLFLKTTNLQHVDGSAIHQWQRGHDL
jgi:hypothetical protein